MFNFFKTIPLFQKLSGLFAEVASGVGRQVDYETATTYTGNPDKVEQTFTAQRWADMSLDPYIAAGLRYRDISRLWVSAAGLSNATHGGFARPQVVFPAALSNGDADLLKFVRWQFDERLTRGMKAVLHQMQQSCLIYGRAVAEVMWTRQQGGEYDGWIVIDDIKDRDPERFLLNPKGLDPGVYLRVSLHSYSMERMPDRKFLVCKNHPYFENLYGVSELRPLHDIQYRLTKMLEYWAHGLEKAGKGQIVGKYGRELLGDANKTKREEFLAQLRQMSNETVTITYKENLIETFKPELEAAGFRDFADLLIAAISLQLTGSSTALIEGKFGSFAKEESTTVRQKSDLEQADAAMLCDCLNYQLITWLVDFNFPQVAGYPFIQLIEPDLIMPTTPADQGTQTDPTQTDSDSQTDTDRQQPSDATRPAEMSALLFAEKEKTPADANTDEPNADDLTSDLDEEEPPSIVRFPSKLALPPIFQTVQKDAVKKLRQMPALSRGAFRRLPAEQKAAAFTVAALGNNQESIEAVKLAIADTLSETSEAAAWAQFLKAYKGIKRTHATGANPRQLMTAFRYARQSAYAQAIDALIDEGVNIYAVRLKTQEDPRVRPSHRRILNVTRLADDEWMRGVKLPLSFNCRCYKQPMTQAEFEEAGGQVTPDNQLPTLPPRFK